MIITHHMAGLVGVYTERAFGFAAVGYAAAALHLAAWSLL